MNDLYGPAVNLLLKLRSLPPEVVQDLVDVYRAEFHMIGGTTVCLWITVLVCLALWYLADREDWEVLIGVSVLLAFIAFCFAVGCTGYLLIERPKFLASPELYSIIKLLGH